jgi:heme/copper-type cytochrome/quinol oxidase subunit 2
MSTIWFIVALIIAVIALLIAAIFAVRVASGLGSHGLSNDFLQRAHSYMTVASVIAWFSVAILIVVAVMAIFISVRESNAKGANAASPGAVDHTFSIIAVVLGFTSIVTFAIGILGALSASEISKSGLRNNLQVKRAYNDSIAVAVSGIVGVVLIVIGLLVFYAAEHKYRRDQLDKQAAKEGTKGATELTQITTAKSPTGTTNVTVRRAAVAPAANAL